jgi:nucleotide-binding universal stress UspA family protein
VNVRPSILCPIDYSEASAAALRLAAAVAEHFVTRLIVLGVDRPSLAAALAPNAHVNWSRAVSEREVEAFVSRVFTNQPSAQAQCEYEVAMGSPAFEIQRVSRERSCDLIVMGSHGLSDPRRWPLGSTTERVLRETTVPVLVTPSASIGEVQVEAARQRLGCIIAPVDLSPASRHQTKVASGLAQALDLPLVLLHVIEPVSRRAGQHRGHDDIAVRSTVDDALAQLQSGMPATCRSEVLVVAGDPAQAIANVVHRRQAGLIVMGLHETPLPGPRMGSVTYRTLCLSPALVLALPPRVSVSPQASGAGSELEMPDGNRQSTPVEGATEASHVASYQ